MLTKLRSLPWSLNRFFFKSGYCPVRWAKASATVTPEASTVSCCAVNWRSAVGINILAININSLRFFPGQLFGLGPCLINVREKAICVMETSTLDRYDHKGVPGTGVLQIRFRKVRVAIRVGVEDADHVQAPVPGGPISGKQIF